MSPNHRLPFSGPLVLRDSTFVFGVLVPLLFEQVHLQRTLHVAGAVYDALLFHSNFSALMVPGTIAPAQSNPVRR